MKPIRRPRHLGPIAVAVAVLLTACSGRGPVGASPAAQVGDRIVSNGDLDRYRDDMHDALERLGSADGMIDPSQIRALFVGDHDLTPPAEGTRTALVELVQLEMLRDLADEFDVEIDDADLDAAMAMLPPEASDMPEGYLDVQLELIALNQAIIADQEAFAADPGDVDGALLWDLYEEQRGGYTQICLGLVAAATEGEADEAADRLNSGESFDDVFADLNGFDELDEQEGRLPCTAAADLEPDFGPDVYEAREGEVLDTLEGGADLWLVPFVEEIDVPSFEDLEAVLRPMVAEFRLRQAFLKISETVRINPRHGVWDVETADIEPVPAPPPRNTDPSPLPDL